MSVAQALNQPATVRAFWLGIAAYVVPTFPIGYVWHLVAFAPAYRDLAMYRSDIIIPFGIASMLIQGAAFSWVYPRVFPERRLALERRTLRARACTVVVVIHDACRGRKERHDISADLYAIGNGIHAGSVLGRWPADRTGLSERWSAAAVMAV